MANNSIPLGVTGAGTDGERKGNFSVVERAQEMELALSCISSERRESQTLSLFGLQMAPSPRSWS